MNQKHSGLSAGHLVMMALGTVIGGSFFLGASIPIRAAGPSVIIAYILGGALVYYILYALSEMTVADADPGSFRSFAETAFGPGVGFVVGWVYWTGMILAISSEAAAVSTFLRIWFPQISVPVMGSIIIILVIIANLFGAKSLSKLESGLAFVKIAAIVGFIVLALALLSGIMTGTTKGIGAIGQEPFMLGGIAGIAGSMLIVMFTYAGFEIIGLAASEAKDSQKTVPKAITATVLWLVGLYCSAIFVILLLIPTSELSGDTSPLVAALEYRGIGWAAGAINVVLVTAILSTMLAATFGLGRMMRSLADKGQAPIWLKDETEVPYRGIIFSGLAMLAGLGLGFILPKVYLFLVSSGGFALLFTYVVIVATHMKFRKKFGCPPNGKCQVPGYPVTSWITLLALVAVIASMPLIEGQGSGLYAGLGLLVFYSICYMVSKRGSRKV